MRYKLLGRSGLRVAELCLGAMTFGEDWGWGASKDESKKIFDAYIKAGGNFIDTANFYTGGNSEKFLGEFMASERDHFVLATKYTCNMRPGDPNAGGTHRKSLAQSLEASLKRLKTDYVDLYWVHAWDVFTPVEEVMRGLDDMVRAGKILYVGVSDTPAWIISQANTLAAWKDWTPFIAMQIHYNLIERTPERELIPMGKALGVGVTAWSPLAGGLLSGKYNTNGTKSSEAKRLDVAKFTDLSERNLAIAGEVVKIAKEMGKSPSQVALAWLCKRSLPIVGARKLSQFVDNLGCLDVSLSVEQEGRLDKVSSIELGFPHDFLVGPNISKVIYGGTKELIDA